MKKFITTLLIFIMSFPYTYGQDYGIGGVTTDDLFSGGNVILRKLMKRDYSEAEGSPYLNDEFTKGKIVFNNGKEYNVLTRLKCWNTKIRNQKECKLAAKYYRIK
jgi:hypothetical protein